MARNEVEGWRPRHAGKQAVVHAKQADNFKRYAAHGQHGADGHRAREKARSCHLLGKSLFKMLSHDLKRKLPVKARKLLHAAKACAGLPRRVKGMGFIF